jgi:uracil phosphoribosyltransferase
VTKIHVICVIASESGLKQLCAEHPDIDISVGAVDTKVNDDGQILPGLGDAGDRIFGTGEVDEESLLHHSKRKRSSPSP